VLIARAALRTHPEPSASATAGVTAVFVFQKNKKEFIT